MAPDPARIPGDPEWLAHRYDPGHDAVHFRHVPREGHRAVTFITDEYLPPAEPIVLRRADALAAAPAEASLHFVFHSAYCCSTLVARAFDRPGWAMGLKEPVILNDLVGWRRRGGRGEDVARVLDSALRLLGRPFGPGEAVVIKPSNIVNVLAPACLQLRPQARALLLHAPLETYLRSIARKDMWGRLWVRTLMQGLLDDGLADFGYSQRDLLGQTDLQIAALGWLAQHRLFEQLAQRFGPDRVRRLSSEQLLADPGAAMHALAGHFGMRADAATIDAIVAGPAFTTHSKSRAEFSGEARAAEHRDAAALHGDEIAKVAAWTAAVAEAAGLSLAVGAPLLVR